MPTDARHTENVPAIGRWLKMDESPSPHWHAGGASEIMWIAAGPAPCRAPLRGPSADLNLGRRPQSWRHIFPAADPE